LGVLRRKRGIASADFFLACLSEESEEYDRRKSEWNIFRKENESEFVSKRRAAEEAAKRDCLAHDIEFDPKEHCGHRYSDQVLPDELVECHLAWQLSNENMNDYFIIIHTYTLLEVQEALAMKLTTLYLKEED
jgi:hypothetical protein